MGAERVNDSRSPMHPSIVGVPHKIVTGDYMSAVVDFMLPRGAGRDPISTDTKSWVRFSHTT